MILHAVSKCYGFHTFTTKVQVTVCHKIFSFLWMEIEQRSRMVIWELSKLIKRDIYCEQKTKKENDAHDRRMIRKIKFLNHILNSHTYIHTHPRYSKLNFLVCVTIMRSSHKLYTF